MELLYVVLFIFLSAFFNGSETAFISINRIRLHAALEKKDRNARVLEKLVRNSENVVGSFLIGTSVCDVAIVIFFTAWLERVLGPSPMIPLYNTLILTPVILVLATLVPKVLFRAFADSIMFPLAYLYYAVYIVIYPVQFVFVRTVKLLLSLFGLKKKKSAFSKDEFGALLDMTSDKGLLKDDEKKLIERIMNFRNVKVKELMVPLIRMSCVEENDTVELASALMLSTGHSRLPVFRMRVDNMVGYVQNKDILSAGKHDLVKKYVRETIFVPDLTPIDHALALMRDKNAQMAFAVDEYGGTAGAITNQDMITRILGEFVELKDDRIRSDGKKKKNRVYTLNGMTNIDELNEELNLKIEKADFETVAGFILNKLGRIPREGETIEHGKYIFRVETASNVRIGKVKIYRRGKKEKKRSKNAN
jgi:putative hemolysin